MCWSSTGVVWYGVVWYGMVTVLLWYGMVTMLVWYDIVTLLVVCHTIPYHTMYGMVTYTRVPRPGMKESGRVIAFLSSSPLHCKASQVFLLHLILLLLLLKSFVSEFPDHLPLMQCRLVCTISQKCPNYFDHF